jgi:phosphoglycolate phosphatase-like HAD superfamily hydrolase
LPFPSGFFQFLQAQLKAPPQSVIFCDFDGPIVDVSERYYQTYRLGLATVQATYQTQQRAALPLQPLSKQQFWWMKQNRVADREIATASGLPDSLVDEFLQQVGRLVNHPHLLGLDQLQPGAGEAIAQIKRQNIRLVLVTLRHPRQVQSFLQAHDLSQDIDQIYGIYDIQAAHFNRVEQKVELLQQAMSEQQCQGFCLQGAWMIGDTEADVVAGQENQLPTVALSCGVRSQAYLQALNPTLVESTLQQAVAQILSQQALQPA